jgi:DNA-binding CsgD family transcriptional regulator
LAFGDPKVKKGSSVMQLSNVDLQNWLAAVTTQPKNPATGLVDWLTGPVKAFFPFGRVILGHGEQVAGQIQLTHTLAIGHDDAYLVQLAGTFDLAKRGSMGWWFNNRKPFNLDPDYPPQFATQFELDEIRTFNLGRIVAHGILNARTSAGTYFSFSAIPDALTDWHLDALTLIAPVLNDLYLSHIAAEQRGTADVLASLTARQSDIVRLIAKGADDKTIAKHLAISEKTVRNHLTEVYNQLGVRKRAQLMALVR